MTDGPDVTLLGAAEIRELAARHGIRPTKQWGQNFVVDANTVRRIVRVAGVGADDTVVEVGPGLGSLTLALLPGRRPGRRRRGRPGARRGAARHRRPVHAPTWPTGSRSCTPTPSPCADLPGAAAHRPRRQPALQRLGPRRAALPRALPDACARSSSWCSSRWPSGSPPRPGRRPTACRASRPPGTPTCARREGRRAASSGRCPTSTPAWSRSPGASRRRPPATRERGLRLRRRGLRPAPQDPARGPGLLGRLAGAAEAALVAAGIDPRTRGEQLDVAAFAAIAVAARRPGPRPVPSAPSGPSV